MPPSILDFSPEQLLERKFAMNKSLENKTIAVLMADGFEEIEFTSPRQALADEGAEVCIISPADSFVKAWNRDRWGTPYKIDISLADASPGDYDALLLPGGVMNPDNLRTNQQAIDFISAFFNAGKPVAAICHAPQLLIEAGVVADRRLTSYPAIRTDLINAGAKWLDAEVVLDDGLVTSRRPDDLDAFNRQMIETFSEEHQHGARPAAGVL